MTTPRIEEQASAMMSVLYDGSMTKHDVQDFLKYNLKEAHQAGRDEAVEVIKGMKWKGEPPESADDITWAVHKERNQALDDTIKALQDNK